MDKLIYKGNLNDFKTFADAGITTGNWNERALKYFHYLGATAKDFNTAYRQTLQLGGVFDPLTLFANGEQGAFYLPEPQYLYQDSAGTTPVTADGDPVGLMLDKSQGLVLGPDIVTNGDFENGTTGWAAVTSASVSFSVVGGEAQFEVLANYAGAGVGATQDLATTPGDWYEAVASVSSSGASGMEITAVDAGVVSNKISNGSGQVRMIFQAVDSLTTFRVGFSGTGEVIGDTGTADNISIRKLPGNHATQPTSASRRLYKTNGSQSWLLDDLVDDGINAQLPDLGTNATLAYADGSGVTILTGQTISGPTPLPTAAETYGAIYLDRPLSAGETESVTAYLSGLRGA